MSGDGGSNFGFVVVCGFAVFGFVLYRSWVRRERRRALAELARERRFGPGPDRLPADFPVAILDDFFNNWILGPNWQGVQNVVGGEDGANSLLAFDVSVRRGRTAIRQTVVARRSFQFQVKQSVAAGYRYRVCGEWQAVTKREGWVPSDNLLWPVEIERLWRMLG